MSLTEKRTLSQNSFVCGIVAILIVAVLYLYNIIKWGSYPEPGFAFRSATGVKVVGVVSEVGRRAGVEIGDSVSMVNSKNFTNEDNCRRSS
jgi:hypothetical protein